MHKPTSSISAAESRTYTISELAREFGVTPRALRFYEDKDMLHPARDGMMRLYSKRDRARLTIIVRLKRLVESVAKLNLYDDAEIETAVQRVQEQITLRSPDERSLLSIERTLKSIATVTRQTLVDLGQRPRSARDLGVPDDPTPTQIQLARRQLRVDQTSEAPFLVDLPIFTRPTL